MKKILFIITILTLSTTSINAQHRAKIDSLLQILPSVKETEDSAQVNVLNGLAQEYLMFNVEEKTKQAEGYVNRSLELSRKLSYSIGLAAGLKNVGIIQMRRKEYRAALRNLFQALALVEDSNSDIELASCFLLIGECYERKENIKTAIDNYIKAFEFYEKHDVKKKVVTVLNNLADLYLKVEQPDQALGYALLSLERAQEGKLRKDRKNTYGILARVYKTSKEFSLAYEYQERYSSLKDSIAKEESLAEIAKLELNHKTQQEALIAKKKQEQRNNLQYLGISAFFVLLFGGLFFVGDVAIPPHTMRRIIFIALFLIFQFLLLLLNPILQEYAGGVALVRLLMNGFFALSFVFLIRYLETRINMRLEKRIRRRIKKRVQKKLDNEETAKAKMEGKAKKKAKKKTKLSNKTIQGKMATS